MPSTLAIGMTVGVRKNKAIVYDYAEQAISSLREVGFKQPLHAFVEPGAEIHVPKGPRLNVRSHANKKKLGCFQNFRHALRYLLAETDADWLLLLQDDAVWQSNGPQILQAAIDDPAMQEVGFLSPYTSKAMVAKVSKIAFKKKQKEQWVEAHFHNRAFWGAVAMCFPRESARRLEEESKRYRNHKHHRKLDVVVGNAMRHELKMPILVRVPSLVDHVGSWSTLGRHRFRGNRWGRRGFAFKAE